MSSYRLSSLGTDADCKVCNISMHPGGSSFVTCDNFGSTYQVDLDSASVTKHRSSEEAIGACCFLDVSSIALGVKNEIIMYDVSALDVTPVDRFHRCELPITCCVYSDTLKVVFDSSVGPNICGIYTEQHGQLFRIPTNEIGVKSFCVNQKSLLCYIDFSANAVILNMVLHGDSMRVVGSDVLRTFPRIKPLETIRDEKISYGIGWHPLKPIIALPSTLGSIILCYEGIDNVWQDQFLPSAHSNVEVNICKFSNCGTFMASAAMDGSIVLWKLEFEGVQPQLEPYNTFSHSGPNIACGLSDIWWNHSDLVVLENNSWGILTNFTHVGNASSEETTMAASVTSDLVPSKFKRLKKPRATDSHLEVDSEDEIDSISVIKQQSLPAKVSPTKSDDAADDSLLDDYHELQLEGKIEKYLQQFATSSLQTAPTSTSHDIVHISSTRYDEKGRRYLVWNSVGSITTRTEAVSNRIEIRFANKSRRNKQEAFPDNWGFVLASLSHEGAVFASDLIDDESMEIDEISKKRQKQGSVVYYHAFSAASDRLHGANESFTLRLNTDEAAQSVAVGCGWIAVATSKGFLRVFSSTGVQLSVTWLKGPVVTLCGFESLLSVVCNTGSVCNGNYNIEVVLYHILPNETTCMRNVAAAPVPLSQGAKLEWMCFSVDSHALFIKDSSEVVSMLTSLGTPTNCWVWTPVLEIEHIKKSSGHKYWPITVIEDKLAYVLLSGENKPAIYPEPVITTRAFRIPICEVKEGKDKGDEANERAHQIILESCRENYIQQLLLDSRLTGKNILGASIETIEQMLTKQHIDADRTLLKLFQDACRLQRLAQAVDLSLKIRTDKALSVAIAIANHFGRSGVAQRVEDILHFRQQLQLDVSSHASTQEPNDQYIESGARSHENMSNPVKIPSSSILDVEQPSTQRRSAAVNPFLKSSEIQSPIKKRAQAIEELGTHSQSPASKRATLSRQSSFSQEARIKKSNDKMLL